MVYNWDLRHPLAIFEVKPEFKEKHAGKYLLQVQSYADIDEERGVPTYLVTSDVVGTGLSFYEFTRENSFRKVSPHDVPTYNNLHGTQDKLPELIVNKRARVMDGQIVAQAPLGGLTSLLNQGIKSVPRVAFASGVVGVGAAAAIISKILGLNQLAFLSLIAIFLAMTLLYVFSRIEMSSDPVVRFSGQLLVIVTTLVFATFVITSLWAAIDCRPSVFVYLYGIEKPCSKFEQL